MTLTITVHRPYYMTTQLDVDFEIKLYCFWFFFFFDRKSAYMRWRVEFKNVWQIDRFCFRSVGQSDLSYGYKDTIEVSKVKLVEGSEELRKKCEKKGDDKMRSISKLLAVGKVFLHIANIFFQFFCVGLGILA